MNPSLDKSMRVDKVRVDTKLRGADLRTDPGGGGINVARAVAKLGGEATALYLEGGCEGKRLTDLLAEEGVSAVSIGIDRSVRESLTVTEDSSGNQYRFSTPGPLIGAEELDAIEERVSAALEPGTLLVASGSLPAGVPDDFYLRLARRAGEQGISLIVDTSSAALKALLDSDAAGSRPYLIKPNLRELSQLVGREDLEQPDIRDAASQLVEAHKVDQVVVSLGAGGAYLVNSRGAFKFDSPSVPVKSRIGAGDSMIAGIVLALARGAEPEEALQRGVAAGAAAVMTPGTDLCRREDAERIYTEVAGGR